MKVQHNSCKQSFLSRFLPHSRWILISSTPGSQAYKNLEEFLAREIVIKKKITRRHHQSFRLTGTYVFQSSYRGQLDRNKLTLYGPRAYRRFDFCTQGLLFKAGNKLVLHLLIDSLTWVAGIYLISSGVFLYSIVCGELPFYYLAFLGVLYLSFQHDFSHAERQIPQLLEDILNGTLSNEVEVHE